MKKITQIVTGLTLFLLLGSLITIFTAPTVYAEAPRSITTFAACSSGGGALPTAIFVPWYQYLPCGPNNTPEFPNLAQGISAIAISVIETLTRLAGLIAVGFIIYGGIQYITSQGDANGINSAKSTIANALIGLVIALMAIAVAQTIGRMIGGGQGLTEALPRVNVTTAIPNLLRIVFSVVGLLSIIFVAIGGFRYVVSGGDPQGTKQAKDTILYALIGMVVAISAFAIIGFVTGRLV